MSKLRLLPTYRGLRLRPYMRFLKEILFGLLFSLFLLPLSWYAYSLREGLIQLERQPFVILLSLLVLNLGFSAYLSLLFMERTLFFAKWDRLARLARFLYEHNYVYEKRSRDGKKNQIRFPRIYLKQNKFDLEVSFELAGSKFQDRFKKIGGDLEVTFGMDFMETEDDDRFKMYRLAYSALLARIKTTDVTYIPGKGIELMKDFYWDFISDPHMMVVGGTGGGKTVLLRTLILALAKIGVVDICDPKRADFATMCDIEAFRDCVFYDVESIVSCFENGRRIMEERYDFMRSEQKRLGHTDMKTYADYGLEPYFIICDEINAFKSMLKYPLIDHFDDALGQLLLLGRQAGCFVILAMQKPAREDLGSKLQANINFRVAVGRLDENGYDLAFEEANRNKEFKFMKYVGGMRVFGRGYAAVKGQVAREFYSPELVKGFVYYDEYVKLERREHLHDSSSASSSLNWSQTEEDIEEFSDDDIPDDYVAEFHLSIEQISQQLGKPTQDIRRLCRLLEEGSHREFLRLDNGRYQFTEEDIELLADLFKRKDFFVGSWKVFLEDYFY